MVKIFSVEGNVGSGKSTLIKYLKTYFHTKPDNIIFVDEPVNLWNEIKDKDGKTILSHFYENSEDWAFSFQIMAYISRLAELRRIIKNNSYATIITERCLHTDRFVFAKMLYDDKKIREIDYQIYLKWFDEFLDEITINGYIYIKTLPEKCHERVIKRNREGETIPLSYLENCDKYHNEWLNKEEKILILDGNLENIQTTDEYRATRIKQFINLFDTSKKPSLELFHRSLSEPTFPIY